MNAQQDNTWAEVEEAAGDGWVGLGLAASWRVLVERHGLPHVRKRHISHVPALDTFIVPQWVRWLVVSSPHSRSRSELLGVAGVLPARACSAAFRLGGGRALISLLREWV